MMSRSGPTVTCWLTGVCVCVLQACAQADMAHRRGYPFDMPYPAASRRMMYPPFHGGEGWASEEEHARYGMGVGPHAGTMGNSRPAQAIDIDFDYGGMKGRGATSTQGNSRKPRGS